MQPDSDFELRKLDRDLDAVEALCRMIVIGFVLCVVAFFVTVLSGCETATPGRKHAEESAFIAAELAKKNEDAIYAKTATANQLNFKARKDLELKKDLESLAIQAKLDAMKWTDTAIAFETVRLQNLHDTAIANYAASQAKNDALRATNEEKNYGTMRKIRAALNPPKNDNQLIDQTQVIEATGATPQPPPLIQP